MSIKPGDISVKPYTARCLLCGGEFKVPEGYKLSVHHMYAHKCPKLQELLDRRAKAGEAAELLAKFI